jgi:hypothetical protein
MGVKLGIKGSIPFCPIGQALKVLSGELGENPFFRSHTCCLKMVYLGVLLLLVANGAMSLEMVDTSDISASLNLEAKASSAA